MRTASLRRDTKETRISGTLKIEGRGRYDIRTGIRFFDHMLELFTKHGGFDLTLNADGDLDVDQHHTVEDVGIVLGQAIENVDADVFLRFFWPKAMRFRKPQTAFWVQDYHFLPLGAELRDLGVDDPIGFFLHTPWPVTAVMQGVPNHRELINAMLA